MASHRPPQPSAAVALEWLRLDPMTDSTIGRGDGSAALAALPTLTAAGQTLRVLAAEHDRVHPVL